MGCECINIDDRRKLAKVDGSLNSEIYFSLVPFNLLSDYNEHGEIVQQDDVP